MVYTIAIQHGNGTINVYTIFHTMVYTIFHTMVCAMVEKLFIHPADP
jgi:hypothetical protein